MADRKLTITIVGDATSAEKAFDSLGSKGVELEGKVKGLSSGFGAFTTVAGGFVAGAAITQGPALLKGLSDGFATLELQGQKAKAVFGDQIGIVKEWSATNANAMGLTKREAVGLAAGMSDLLKPMGFTSGEAAGMSTKILGLSGALAEWSMGQYKAADVAEILQDAIMGNTDRLDALGIKIQAADIDARLAAKGQSELTGAARRQAEALAVQEMLFEQSKDAQDAYAAGAGSAARKQAESAARTREAGEAMQMGLGPAITTVMGLLADGLIPVFDGLAWAMDHIVVVGPALAAGVLTIVVPAFIAWATAANAAGVANIVAMGAAIAAAAPFIAMAVVVAALVAGIVLLVKNWDTVTEKVPALGVATDAVKGVMQGFVDWINDPLVPTVTKIGTTVVDMTNTAVGFVRDNWGKVWDPWIKTPMEAIKLGVETYMGLVKVTFETAFGVVRGIFEVFAGLFTGDWDRMKDGLLTIVTSLKDGAVEGVRLLITGIGELSGLAWSAMKGVGDNMLDGMMNGLKSLPGLAGSIAEQVWSALKGVINSGIALINDWIPNSLGAGPFQVALPNNPIPTLYTGTRGFRGGFAIVGERGPELVRLPAGADVFSNRESRRMGMGGEGGVTVNMYNAVINATGEGEARRGVAWVGAGIRANLRARGSA